MKLDLPDHLVNELLNLLGDALRDAMDPRLVLKMKAGAA